MQANALTCVPVIGPGNAKGKASTICLNTSDPAGFAGMPKE